MERHCDKRLLENWFPRAVDWRSRRVHDKLKVFLVVCVDDFKLSGPKRHFEKGLELIGDGVAMGGPTEPCIFLGRLHEIREATIDGKEANMAKEIAGEIVSLLAN